MDNPMPKKRMPNLHFFMRSARSCSFSRGMPVSSSMPGSNSTPLTSARSAHSASKSLRGLTWGLGGVGAPEDDKVGAVLDLAEGAGDLADALESHAGGPVADGGGGIDAGADAVGDGDGDALGLAGG